MVLYWSPGFTFWHSRQIILSVLEVQWSRSWSFFPEVLWLLHLTFKSNLHVVKEITNLNLELFRYQSQYRKMPLIPPKILVSVSAGMPVWAPVWYHGIYQHVTILSYFSVRLVDDDWCYRPKINYSLPLYNSTQEVMLRCRCQLLFWRAVKKNGEIWWS